MSWLRNQLRFHTALQLILALESGEETLVGGQAVLEGVMMRSPHAWGIAVRKPSGEVLTHSEPLAKPSEKSPWKGWPFVRGVMTLGQAMILGFKALRYSANVALDEVPPDENGKKLEIEAPTNSEANKYVNQVKLNGVVNEKNWVDHFDLLKGGKLQFDMKAQPNKTRGTTQKAFPYSYSKP